jgi:mRNA interferase MazF
MVMVRGEIWWAQLPPPRGSAPAKRRPVLIIQSDSFNRSALNTVICAMITSNMDLACLPGNLPLEKAVSGLDKSSVVNFSQIATIDKSDLSDLVCMLPRNMVLKVTDCLKRVLDIS